MKTYRFAALLVLSLSASTAFAARDEVLIQQTRKNQLAHDAQANKAAQDKDAARAAATAQPQPQPQRRHG